MKFKISFQQWVLSGFIVSLLLVFVVGYNSYRSIENFTADAKLVDHTREVKGLSNLILGSIINIESSQRAFVATGSERFLEQYKTTHAQIMPMINQLRQLTIDNEKQTLRIDSLARLASEKIEHTRLSIDIRTAQGYEAARAFLEKGDGLALMNRIREINTELNNEESRLLDVRQKLSAESMVAAKQTILAGSGLVVVVVIGLFLFILRTFRHQKKAEEDLKENNDKLEVLRLEDERRNWMLTGSAKVADSLRNQTSVQQVGDAVIQLLARYTGANIGALYLSTEDGDAVKLTSTFAYDFRRGNRSYVKPGEGLIGQAMLERKSIVFGNVPNDYVHVASGIGEASPEQIIIVPCMADDEVKAIIELGFSTSKLNLEKEFLEGVANSIGITLNALEASDKLKELLEKSQQQSEELEAQQEELRITNEELHKQTQLLQASEEELRVQQEELQQANVELEEKAAQLEETNKTVEQAREAIAIKAGELELTGKYKSEFLANMSHELRTPLNSILILAKMLSENKHQHLNDEEVKYASVIHNAGNDLLTLINDILDLSKIESGKIDLNIERFELKEVEADLKLLFDEVANNKKIEFGVNIAEDAPFSMVSDRLRFEQIIRNLLSNAFKFTSPGGGVSVNLGKPAKNIVLKHDKLQGVPVLAIGVKDSGIGIPPDKQKLIFEAFQQADGSTSRKYGGTGLGLSISRELASILGGEIQVESTPGVGSTFTLFIPVELENRAPLIAPEPKPVVLATESAATEEELEPVQVEPSEDTILVVEDDVNFSDIVKSYAENSGFKVLTAYDGKTGLELARTRLPQAIILDIKLPEMDGWTVLRKLKSDPNTREIPVHIMSAMDGEDDKAQKLGALNFLKKPVQAEKLQEVFGALHAELVGKIKSVLVIEDQEIHSEILRKMLADQGVEVRQAFTGAEAEELLNTYQFDCLILDLKLPDIDGVELLDKIKKNDKYRNLPVVINTAMEMNQAMLSRVMKHSNAMIMKSGKSDERLLDEVNLFFNKIKADAAKPAPQSSRRIEPVKPKGSQMDQSLKNKKILLVDDDMRNVFALSAALQGFDLEVTIAGNGREAIEKLKENDKIDLVLMDIMMPEMDGYQAMTEIRKEKKWANLPIIALTAKAMKNDREKCIEAGASDYISKPVDVEKLLSLIRVWMSR